MKGEKSSISTSSGRVALVSGCRFVSAVTIKS